MDSSLPVLPSGSAFLLSDAVVEAIADSIAGRLGERLAAGPPALLDLEAAANWLGVSARTVESLVALAEIPIVRIGPSRSIRRFELASLVAYARRSTRTL